MKAHSSKEYYSSGFDETFRFREKPTVLFACLFLKKHVRVTVARVYANGIHANCCRHYTII